MPKEIKLLTDAQLAWRRYGGLGIGLPIIAFLTIGIIGLLIVDTLLIYYLWRNRAGAWYKDNMGSALIMLACGNITFLLLDTDYSIMGGVIFLFGFFTGLLAIPTPED